MASIVPPKSKTKITLALITVVGVAAAYSYFAYSRDLFPFTKAFKRKLNTLIKGKEPTTEEDLDKLLGLEESEGGLVDEFGSVNEPRGGTGARGIGEAGGLEDPAIKGDLNMANLYQQELYRQLFLPYEDNPKEGEAIPGDTIVRGGDIPASGTPGVPEPYKYPFPVDERLYDMYGLYPPGGSYSGRNPYSPIHGGSYVTRPSKPVFNPAVLNCHDCPEGESWDNCMCRCAPVDSPRLMCYRADCECPGEELGNNDDHYGGGDGVHSNGGDPSCPPGLEFDGCRCQCVTPDTPRIECIRNCTECPQDQWYSFCTGQCVSGRQRQCEPEVSYQTPDIPEWIPDNVVAEIGDLRNLRDRLLQEIDDLRDQLQDEIDTLQAKIEEEREKRLELEELVDEIDEEVHEEIENNTPPRERIEHNEEREERISRAQEIIQRVMEEIRERMSRVTTYRSRVTATVSEVNNVDNRIRIYSSYSGRTGSSRTGSYSSSSSGSGTYANTSGGGATACAGGHCVTANAAARVGDLSRKERQYAFSKLQHRSRRMKTIKEKPTAFLKNKQFLNVLPPIVAKRHLASRLVLS